MNIGGLVQVGPPFRKRDPLGQRNTHWSFTRWNDEASWRYWEMGSPLMTKFCAHTLFLLK